MTSRKLLLRATTLAAVALLPLLSGVALAQDEATVEMARARFREGVQFYDQRQYEKARLAFLQAYALKPHPTVLLNLAQSELRGDRPEDAAGHFAEYLRTTPDASEAEKQEAELGFAAAKSKVGEISVVVDGTGATVLVDGVERGTTPLATPLYVRAGAHVFEARSGDRRATKNVTVTAAGAATVILPLRAGAAAAAPVAEGEPDEPAEPAPDTAPEPAADAGETDEPASVELDEDSGRGFVGWAIDTPVAWVGFGVGVVGLGASVGFAFASKAGYDDANAIKSQIQEQTARDTRTLQNAKLEFPGYPCQLAPNAGATLNAQNRTESVRAYQAACSRFADSRDQGESMKTLAIVSGAVGGAAIAGTVVYYLVKGKHDAESAATARGFRAEVVPVVGGGVSGLLLQGSF